MHRDPDTAVRVRHQNWSQYLASNFGFTDQGRGSLQIEIGEDKTSDVERYRGGAH